MESWVLKTKDFGDIIEQTYYKSKSIVRKGNKSSKEASRLASRSRSISRIKEIVYCNDFDYFFTLTLKDVSLRLAPNLAIDYFNKEIKNYSKFCNYHGYDFKYVYVFELTKKGSVHVHGFGKNFCDLYINQYGHLSSLKLDKIGFQNFAEASKVNVNYLIKYIMKSPLELKSIYHASRGFKKAEVTKFHDCFNKLLDFPFTAKNKYCYMATYVK